MSISALPEWAFRILLGLSILAVYMAGTWLFRRFAPAPKTGEVLGSPMAMGGGVLGLVFGFSMFALGFLGGGPPPPDQRTPWALLVIVPVAFGIWMISMSLGVRAHFDASGVRVRRRRDEWRRYSWRDIRRARRDWSQSGVVLVFADGKKVDLWPDMAGSVELLEAARDAGVAGAAELFTPPASGRR